MRRVSRHVICVLSQIRVIFRDRPGCDRIHPSGFQLAVATDQPLFVTVTKKITKTHCKKPIRKLLQYSAAGELCYWCPAPGTITR